MKGLLLKYILGRSPVVIIIPVRDTGYFECSRARAHKAIIADQYLFASTRPCETCGLLSYTSVVTWRPAAFALAMLRSTSSLLMMVSDFE